MSNIVNVAETEEEAQARLAREEEERIKREEAERLRREEEERLRKEREEAERKRARGGGADSQEGDDGAEADGRNCLQEVLLARQAAIPRRCR